MRTKWFDSVSRSLPLNEYPRPQFARSSWLNLNGQWDYRIRKTSAPDDPSWDGKILVPFCPESELSGVSRVLQPDETLIYRRYFSVPEDWKDSRVILHFGAVDYLCTVSLNGTDVGSHRGGYIPFSFDITGLLAEENELIVSVTDPTDKGLQQRGKQRLSPSGIFYTPLSGIWQTVWLEPVPVDHFTDVLIVPDIDSSTVSVTLMSKEDCRYKLTLSDSNGGILVQSAFRTNTEAVVSVSDSHLWTPEDPYLYSLRFESGSDIVTSYFGMRKFSVTEENGHPVFALNNKPYFMFGPLDQGYWPESNLTPPTEEAMVFDLATMKSLGFNTLRKHIKTEPLRWYYLCDRIGMIVWQDMVSGGKCRTDISAIARDQLGIKVPDDTEASYRRTGRSDPGNRKEYEDELRGLLGLLKNCVSLAVWVPFNECWGQFDANRITDIIRGIDASRLIDQASGWVDQGGGDFKSLHTYYKKLHEPKKADPRIFIISECGGFGFREDGHTWSDKTFSYGRLKTHEELMAKYESFVENELLPLRKKGLSAVIYTQLSDVETELNGILSYDREVCKFDSERLSTINRKTY